VIGIKNKVVAVNIDELKVITAIEEAGLSDNGWTYFLLSACRQYAKIGRTIGLIETRLKYAEDEQPYSGLNLEFSFAINNENLEMIFFNYFSYYHVKYALNYNYGEPREDNRACHYYTREQALEKLIFYNKTRMADVFRKTTGELLHFPAPLSAQLTLTKVLKRFQVKP